VAHFIVAAVLLIGIPEISVVEKAEALPVTRHCLFLADIVAKRFWMHREAILIQEIDQ
jgi:hypothetical protein